MKQFANLPDNKDLTMHLARLFKVNVVPHSLIRLKSGELTLFSLLTGNADMHLKNFSIIDSGSGLTQLAPAYDLLSTRLVISENEDPEEMALTLNGRKRKLKAEDCLHLANSLNLN